MNLLTYLTAGKVCFNFALVDFLQIMGFSHFFQKLVPSEKKFFPLFESMSALVVQGAQLQNELLQQDEPSRAEDLFEKIRLVENQSDEVAQQLFEELDRTFITPFDREDIHRLTSTIDSLIDMINTVSHKIIHYDPRTLPVRFKDMAHLILKGSRYMDVVVKQLPEHKKPKKILKTCRKMREVEAEADELYHSMIGELFREEKDAIELIKIKDILDSLEQCADKIQDVSDVVRTIIIKMA